MGTVALFTHHERPEAAELAVEAARRLHAQGHVVRVPKEDGVDLGAADAAVPEDEVGRGADLAISLGGDGTVLHTVELVAAWAVNAPAYASAENVNA